MWGRLSLILLALALASFAAAVKTGFVNIFDSKVMLPWQSAVEASGMFNSDDDDVPLFIYVFTACLVLQILVRQTALVVMGPNHPKRGIAPRLATKIVSVVFDVIATIAGIKGLFYPENAVETDSLYGRSEHAQFHFSVAAGYFLWAVSVSIFYRGSVVAIVQNFVQYAVCMLALGPFMQRRGSVFLLGQASNLVLDLYSCGRLLVRRRSKGLFLKYIHPAVFFIVRVVITSFVSYGLMKDLFQILLDNDGKTSAFVVVFLVLATAVINMLNLFWFWSAVVRSGVDKRSIVNVQRGGKSTDGKMKWFALNLNWFDIGVTLVFGDLRKQNKKLKITNSSYRYARPGLALPLVVAGIAMASARTVASQFDFIKNDLSEDELLLLAIAVFAGIWAVESAAKFGIALERRSVAGKSHRAPADAPYYKVPNVRRLVDQVKVRYHNEDLVKSSDATTKKRLVGRIIASTPLPKGKKEFSSIHVVAPPLGAAKRNANAERIVRDLVDGNAVTARKEMHVHRLSERCASGDPVDEFEAIFTVCSDMILAKADRASLVIFVGFDNDAQLDFFAAAIGMLPFRGITTALVTQRKSYGDLMHYISPSTVFEIDGANAARMGMFPIKAVFGALHDKTVVQAIDEWYPVDLSPYINHPDQTAHPAVQLPFKIGALTLPMLTHKGDYANSLDAIRDLLQRQHGEYFPIVSCGQTCDALGYGRDLLEALGQKDGMYFNHPSGETNKRWECYADEDLFASIAKAKRSGLPIVVIAMGGGVNGNCIGLVAALANVHLVEVPTTVMHYNDATTSAKKAFSLVKNNKILSKNIMGAFYIPSLVFCIAETFITLSSASVHASVGEATKTMNMLGNANSETGAADYFNILGAQEFASDFTKIVKEVSGFDALVRFIEDPETRREKAKIIAVGTEIRELIEKSKGRSKRRSKKLEGLFARRAKMMRAFRARYYALGSKADKIKSFLSVINEEIVKAKAMFLSYSDPFEKYRALLFEYAHTLGHGVEAFLNLAYTRAAERGVPVPEEAIRLHGQCVGMAVLWAGQMSYDLGELRGEGFKLHQGFVYLHNRHGGFDFTPCRRLLDALGITKDEFCEGVLEVVRRDNKRGYCKCSDETKSVDQLVTGRPGKMMRSENANAELRYLVEVDEDWQRRVLGMAFDGYFDKVADIDENGRLVFKDRLRKNESTTRRLTSKSGDVGAYMHRAIGTIYK